MYYSYLAFPYSPKPVEGGTGPRTVATIAGNKATLGGLWEPHGGDIMPTTQPSKALVQVAFRWHKAQKR
jgi:hypothetical protein